MKKLICILGFVMFSVLAFSQKPFQATLYFTDGTVRTGIAELVGLREDKFVNFRENTNSKTEKISSISIKKIIYDNGEEIFEYDNLKVYVGMRQKRTRGPVFLRSIKRGYTSLYKVKSYFTGTSGVTHSFDDYYVIRESEPAAKLISSVGGAAKNKVFRAQAPKYFSDYKELSLQIKKKKYKWDDIEQVIDIYNEWAVKNKKF